MHVHYNYFENATSRYKALRCCHFAFLFKSLSFHLWNTLDSLRLFSPTIVFVMPSQQTDAIHLIGRQLLSLLADD